MRGMPVVGTECALHFISWSCAAYTSAMLVRIRPGLRLVLFLVAAPRRLANGSIGASVRLLVARLVLLLGGAEVLPQHARQQHLLVSANKVAQLLVRDVIFARRPPRIGSCGGGGRRRGDWACRAQPVVNDGCLAGRGRG